MESAIIKVSDKVWLNLGGDVINNFCEMCGAIHDKPYYVVQDPDGDTWTVCSECKERMDKGFPKYDVYDEQEAHKAVAEWALNGEGEPPIDPRD